LGSVAVAKGAYEFSGIVHHQLRDNQQIPWCASPQFAEDGQYLPSRLTVHNWQTECTENAMWNRRRCRTCICILATNLSIQHCRNSASEGGLLVRQRFLATHNLAKSGLACYLQSSGPTKKVTNDVKVGVILRVVLGVKVHSFSTEAIRLEEQQDSFEFAVTTVNKS
jgi:subtilase family serine protease